MDDPKLPLTRRDVVSAGVGYALAVSPVTAWAVTTSDDGLDTADVTIPVGKDSLPAFVALPKGKGPYPCVIVIHEIFGLHEYIRDVCRRLAKEGYVAVSPYLYFRQGNALAISDIKKLVADIVNKVPQSGVMADLDATVAWIRKQRRCDAKRLGITGFCWGGGVTWMYSAHSPDIKAGVAWYGRLAGEASPNQPKFPSDIAPSLKVPVLGLYGEKDEGIPISDVEKMRKLLAKGKSGSKINVFSGAEHGFHADYRPSFNPKAASEGWNEMLAWFREHGVK